MKTNTIYFVYLVTMSKCYILAVLEFFFFFKFVYIFTCLKTDYILSQQWCMQIWRKLLKINFP